MNNRTDTENYNQEELRSSQETFMDRFKWILSEYGGNVYVADMDTYELLYVNQKSCDTLQASARQLIGRRCYEVVQGRNSPCPFCTNARLKKDETYEWEFYNPNLERTFIIKNRMLDWEGHRARIELSYDMYSAEFKLAKKDQEREAILKTIPAGMVRIDARDCSTILWYNARFLEMIGYTETQFEEELHCQCSYLQPSDLERALTLIKGLKESGENIVFEAKAYTREKEERIWTVTLCYISGDDSWDGIPSLYSVGLDITDERKQIETLQHKAEKDPLTGIENRAEAEKQIKKYLHENRDSMAALMIIDVDNFKRINDTRGHMTGDIVLCEMASGMKRLMRESDVVGRIGGDEFIIFMKHITSADMVQNKAEELLDMFRHLFESEKSSVTITCSIGIALYPKAGSTFKEIYENADRALYQSKVRGKNIWAIYQYDMLKQLKENSYIGRRTDIDSEIPCTDPLNSLIHYVLDSLARDSDIDQAVNHVLEAVGRHLDVSRAYIFENTEDGSFGSNTYEWCQEGIPSQMASLQNINYRECGDYNELFDENLTFYCRNIHTLKPEHEQLFSSQGVCSTLQCAFKNGTVFGGFVGFDECSGRRLWTQEEVDTLLMVSQILAAVLKQKKESVLRQKAEEKAEQYEAILDNLTEPVCVAGAERGILLYGNEAFRKAFPERTVGAYRAHSPADGGGVSITWNGEKAYLYQGNSC